MTMAMTTIQNLMAKKAELVAEMRATGADALKGVFKEFFEAHPTCQAVKWRQYTPYFNDGEPCEFLVHDFSLKMDDTPEDAEDDYGDEGFESTYGSQDKKRPGLTAAVRAVRDISKIDDEIFEMSFGDHVGVTATHEGFEVEEYSHD
jgi:hypothetical protein